MLTDEVWARIERNEGAAFETATGLSFTYRVPGQFIRVTRDGREINRVLSRSNFRKAAELMPAERPSQLSHLQGSAYVWAILMDERIRKTDW